MLKGNQRLHTLVHTDKIKHHSKKKKEVEHLKPFILVFVPLLLIYYLF